GNCLMELVTTVLIDPSVIPVISAMLFGNGGTPKTKHPANYLAFFFQSTFTSQPQASAHRCIVSNPGECFPDSYSEILAWLYPSILARSACFRPADLRISRSTVLISIS